MAWLPARARAIRPDPRSAVPVFDHRRLPKTFADRLVWDMWPVRLRSGPVASVDGHAAWMALSVPDHVPPESRHAAASIHVALVSPDGTWSDAGPLFPAGSTRGSRQWAGCALHDPASGRLVVWYSAVGSPERPDGWEQEIVVAEGRLQIQPRRLEFGGWSEHRTALRPDGVTYRHTGERELRPGFADSFRDPFHFRDPRTGRDYLLFMATMGSAATTFDGAVGIAESAGNGDALSPWRLLPPLITADGVNKELERPHIVARDGRYYLLFSCHAGNFGPGIVAPEGLYGFVADDALGPYLPLNGSGLVLANPAEEPNQAYSWLVLPDGQVHSFADYPGTGARPMSEAARSAWFAGRVAPTLQLDFEGDRTRLVPEATRATESALRSVAPRG